jgi:hypothetical protein
VSVPSLNGRKQPVKRKQADSLTTILHLNHGQIVGGVLVGQTLISAAGVRGTISQVEKFNTAANTFFGKYGYLPGDIPAGPAAQFGFVARGTSPGEGDGNGILEGISGGITNSHGACEGEMITFWVDLSAAHLIQNSFTLGSPASPAPPTTWSTTPNLSAYFPAAKIGGSNVFFASNGESDGLSVIGTRNYFGLAAVADLGVTTTCELNQMPGLTVQQAYAMDSKVDDGFPGTGNVFVESEIVNSTPIYSGGAPGGGAIAGSPATCFDNNNISITNGGIMRYSVSQNGGAGVNCTLNFRMQAGD